MSETIDTIEAEEARQISEESSSGHTAGATETAKLPAVRLLKGPGIAKAQPGPHQRTLDRWEKKAPEVYKGSPFRDVLCDMVEKRVSFVGGGRFDLEIEPPVPFNTTCDRLKKMKNISPERVSMILFQSLWFGRISKGHIRSICQLLAEKRYASLPSILSQMGMVLPDAGIKNISSSAGMAVESVVAASVDMERSPLLEENE